jgi:leucyl-tRNA synthetase
VRVKFRPIEVEPDLVQVWIVSEAAVCKLENQYDEVQVLSKHQGMEFVGAEAKTPLTGHIVPIAAASFLDSHHGTGLVYSSPSGSPQDYMAFKEAQRDGRLPQELKVINTVLFKDKKGQEIRIDGECPAAAKIAKYGIKTSTNADLEKCKQELYKEEHYGGVLVNVGEFSDIPIRHAKDKIHAALVGCKLGGTLYEPSRRAVTRAGQPVIVARLRGQWFLNYSGVDTSRKLTRCWIIWSTCHHTSRLHRKKRWSGLNAAPVHGVVASERNCHKTQNGLWSLYLTQLSTRFSTPCRSS